jgi:putative endonuclease
VERTYWVYILASRRNGTLYVGVTSDLAQRVWLHKCGEGSAFTRQYRVHTLVHAEAFGDVNEAIAREKAIKKWRRAWKLELIEKANAEWRDLSAELVL